MPLATSTEEARFVLVTSDNPPVSHAVSRSRLCALSKTFDDLLSLPTGLASDDSANKMELTETSVELEGFIKVIRGEEIVEKGFSGGGTFDDYDNYEEEKLYWVNLARMADKYDCSTARLYVTSLLWRLKAQNLRLDVVFHLAIALEDYQLVQQTCAPAIENKWHLDESYVSEVWRNRLLSSFRRRKLQLFEKLNPVDPVAAFSRTVNCSCTPTKRCVWEAGIMTTLRTYSLETSFTHQFFDRLTSLTMTACTWHKGEMKNQLERVESELPRLLELVDSITL